MNKAKSVTIEDLLNHNDKYLIAYINELLFTLKIIRNKVTMDLNDQKETHKQKQLSIVADIDHAVNSFDTKETLDYTDIYQVKI